MLLLLVASMLAVASKIQIASADADEWPMFHHDLSHTGYSTSTATNTNQILWSYKTNWYIGHSSPAVANGMVFVGSCDDNVYALSAATGALVWNYTTGGWVASPAIADSIDTTNNIIYGETAYAWFIAIH